MDTFWTVIITLACVAQAGGMLWAWFAIRWLELARAKRVALIIGWPVLALWVHFGRVQ